MIEGHQLKSAGLKITLPRLKIFHILEQAPEHHLSAEHVYKKLVAREEVVSLATVYRVLTQFEAAGIVERHNFEGGYSVFELRQATHHDHLVCTKCGRVDEFFDKTISLSLRVNHQTSPSGFFNNNSVFYRN